MLTSTIIPVLRYRDAPSMVNWLCNSCGFQRHLIVEDGSGGIAHAQLTLGNSMVMLGTASEDEFGKLQRTPLDHNGTTHSSYVVVPDADAVYERTRSAGIDRD